MVAPLRIREEQLGGLLQAGASKRTVTHSMSVRNTKRVPVEITVRDRVPASLHKDIKARPCEGRTQWTRASA